ncbi:MAG: phosphoenolpyruvate--protein phosphotransferase [Pirellulales bacterium]
MRKGLAVSPGVAVGVAYCIDDVFVSPGREQLQPDQVQTELQRFSRACRLTTGDLQALQRKVSSQFGEEEAAIFRVHEAIVHDAAFSSKIRDCILRERLSADAALHRVLGEYTTLFSRTRDSYIKERVSDVRDVVLRLSAHLSEVLQPESPALPGPLVLVAKELLPSQVVVLGKREMIGIVTQSGGQTSHAAILARSRGIPAVSGVSGILNQVRTGDTVVVDGREGLVLVNPDPETESAYRKLQREFFLLKDELAANRDVQPVSADGQPVELFANVNNLADLKTAAAMGASGVGLYRTEYLFLTHRDVPDEQEQYQNYQKMIQRSPGGQITIRTLDLGGDKTVPYFGRRREANPFMGWRSIRLSFEHPEFFAAQIRAILRAAGETDDPSRVRIMFPMITTLEEIRRVRSMVRRIQRELAQQGIDSHRVPLGLMLEVPAAAISIDTLLSSVDFVSIGSNDLVQYLMAADRDNPKVSHLCQPLSPPVLRLLNSVIHTCNHYRKPVTLCGEMAGAPRAFVLLFAMGLRSFSMSPAFIPTIKELTSHLTRQRAAEVLQHALSLKTTRQVNRYMADQIAQIAPNLRLLDTA